MTRISVITPFLDAQRYLPQAIGSVLSQTLEDWELLLVDDGSRDESLAIAQRAARSDPRIRVLAAPAAGTRGAAAARNRGIANARSDLVALLDADDLFEPEKLAVDVALLDAHPEAAMVYGPSRWWRDGPHPWQWTESMRREAGRLHDPPRLLAAVILANRWRVPCTCAVSIRRDATLAVGGFEERFRLYEDQTLWAKLFLAYPVLVQPRCLARYRQHEGSVSAEAARSGLYSHGEAHAARAAFLDWLAGYLEHKGVHDRDILSALRLARAPYGGSGMQHLFDLARLAARRQSRRLLLVAHRLRSLVARPGKEA